MTDALFFLDQHGCAKNQVDAELIIGIMRDIGWSRTDEPERAALIIVNSCGFIEPAKKESLDAVIEARAAYPAAKILLAGCLAERYANDLAGTLVEADAFFGNGDLSRLPEVIDSLFGQGFASAHSATRDVAQKAPGVAPDSLAHVQGPEGGASYPVGLYAQEGVCSGERPELLSFPRSAYVKITEGCDNRCAFCAIPLIRGSLRSRPSTEIAEECRSLVARGVWELNLIGQDLASYGKGLEDARVNEPSDNPGSAGDQKAPMSSHINPQMSPLAGLLQAISALEGDFRVRLLYLHPDNFPSDILPVMAKDRRFYPYFDIPFQSGAASVLPRMNRRGNPAQYLSLVADIRAAFRESPYRTAALRTTFLVGFPGESDADFEETLRFCREVRSLWSGAFVWSREEGTKASEMKGRVPKKTAQARLAAIQEAQRRITPHELEAFVGADVEVLVEEIIPDEADSSETADASEATAARVDASTPADLSFPARGERGPDGIPASRLALGRAWFQAPEVDGSVVLQFEDGQLDLTRKAIEPGSVVMARIIAVNGVDVEAVVR